MFIDLKNMYNYRQFHEKLKLGYDRLGKLSKSAINNEYGGNCKNGRKKGGVR
jgi:hypothetical protein